LLAILLLLKLHLTVLTIKIITDYFQAIKGHSINWLRPSDAVSAIIDELLRSGIAYHTIGVGKLLKHNDTTRLVVTVSFKRWRFSVKNLGARTHKTGP